MMKFLSCLIAVALVPCFALVADAQTSETTVKVKTGKVKKTTDLSTVDYYVVDPDYNRIIGTRSEGQSVPVDCCLVSTKSGKVLITDSKGSLVEVDPLSLRGQYRIVGKKLCYYRPDFISTKALLEQRVTNDEASGLITTRQAKHIRNKLSRMTNYVSNREEATYTRSAVRTIEYRFAGIQNDLAMSLADTRLRKEKNEWRSEKAKS